MAKEKMINTLNTHLNKANGISE